MTEGDRITHRKDGLGTVLKVYWSRSTVRCRMDSGKTTVYSTTRVQPAPPEREVSPRRRRRRRTRDGDNVDYALLDRARAAVQAEHPGADEYVAIPYGGRACVEVWRKGRARVVRYDED